MKSVNEFVALAKAKPGTLNYSHPGKGSSGHLGFELFKRLAGIDVAGIGYRGYPQMVPDIASGLINSTFLSANQALAQVQTGAIRIIGAISDGRSKYFPDVPTLAEQGFAEAQVMPWFGVRGPCRDAAAGGQQDQRRRWKRRWRRPRSSKSSISPAAIRRARRLQRSPTSSRKTSRCGRGWRRKPASPQIEASARAVLPGAASQPMPSSQAAPSMVGERSGSGVRASPRPAAGRRPRPAGDGGRPPARLAGFVTNFNMFPQPRNPRILRPIGAWSQ